MNLPLWRTYEAVIERHPDGEIIYAHEDDGWVARVYHWESGDSSEVWGDSFEDAKTNALNWFGEDIG